MKLLVFIKEKIKFENIIKEIRIKETNQVKTSFISKIPRLEEDKLDFILKFIQFIKVEKIDQWYLLK
jgi:hypothetical protein